MSYTNILDMLDMGGIPVRTCDRKESDPFVVVRPVYFHGNAGRFSNPVFQAAIDRIIKACRKAGKKCIFFTGTVEGIDAGFARGFDGMAYSLDAAIFIEALRERVEKARQLS